MDPVPAPAQVTVLGGGRAAKAAAAAASNPERSEAESTCTSKTPRAPACFAGELGLAIDEADALRVQLLERARQVSNGNAAFNALQYPLGSIALYEKLRGAPNRNFLLPAALAAGAYGFVNAGVVDRERHYLREAYELHCAIVRASPNLYLDADINVRTTSADQYGSLSDQIQRLDSALAAFETQRISLSFDLKPRSGTSAPTDARARRIAEAGGKGGGTAGSDKTREVLERWALQAATATSLRERLFKLRRTINDAGALLRRDVVDITQQAQGLLSERVPLPRNPKDSLTDLKTVQVNLMAESGNAGVQAMDPVLPRELLAGLAPASTDEAKKFAAKFGRDLQQAYASASDWGAAHDERVRSSQAETEKLNCSQRLAPVPVRETAKPPGGSKPPTDNTAGSNGDNKSGGTAPLPKAP